MADNIKGSEQTLRSRAVEFLALDRNIVVVSGATLLLSFGESLWRKFLPRYLQALGAPIRAIGLFGSLEDFLDGVYQYPGGWLGDRLGRRTALVLFVGIATAGYVTYRVAPSWPWIFAGMLLVSAWFSMASPALFAVVGDALPAERRAMGFTVQSILKRIPLAIAPFIGGLLIARMGLIPGIHRGFEITILLGIATIVVLRKIDLPRIAGPPANMRGVWQSLPSSLRWLLASDIFIRACDGLVDVFLVIYATTVVGVSAPKYGALVAVQMGTTILISIPAARIAGKIGKKPFVIATFISFALFPLAVVLAHSFATLLAAFVVGGVREIGEPSRKALIVDLAQPALRARSVGLYYFVRSLAIAPAAFIGGILWEQSPVYPFYAALALGILGTLLFTITVKEEHAG
ncbi:MAG: MFS transporter [Acidobacteriota bacterium]